MADPSQDNTQYLNTMVTILQAMYEDLHQQSTASADIKDVKKFLVQRGKELGVKAPSKQVESLSKDVNNVLALLKSFAKQNQLDFMKQKQLQNKWIDKASTGKQEYIHVAKLAKSERGAWESKLRMPLDNKALKAINKFMAYQEAQSKTKQKGQIKTKAPVPQNTPAQRAQKDKENEKLAKSIAHNLAGLAIFRKTEKVATDLIRLNILKWSAQQTGFLKKLGLFAVGMNLPESLGQVLGFAIRTSIELGFQRLLLKKWANSMVGGGIAGGASAGGGTGLVPFGGGKGKGKGKPPTMTHKEALGKLKPGQTFVDSKGNLKQVIQGPKGGLKIGNAVAKASKGGFSLAGMIGGGAKLAKGAAGGIAGIAAALLIDPVATMIKGGINRSGMTEGQKGGWTRGVDALAGAGSGAFTGAALGSIIPGIGTAVGGIAGAIIGGLSGLFKKELQPMWDKLFLLLSKIPWIGKFFEEQLKAKEARKVKLPDGTIVDPATGAVTTSGGTVAPWSPTGSGGGVVTDGSYGKLPIAKTVSSKKVQTEKFTREQALKAVASSSYYEPLRSSKYIGIQGGSFLTDIQALQTGHQGLIEDTVASSPLLRSLGLQYTSALGTKGGPHSGTSEGISHFSGKKSDFTFAGINKLTEAQRKAISAEFYTRSGGMLEAVFEQDKKGNWHIDERVTEKGRQYLDELQKQQMSPIKPTQKPKDSDYISPVVSADPDASMMANATKTLVGFGVGKQVGIA